MIQQLRGDINFQTMYRERIGREKEEREKWRVVEGIAFAAMVEYIKRWQPAAGPPNYLT